MLDEVAEGGAEARGDEVGGVAEEEGCLGARFRVAVATHVVDDADRGGDGAGLETCVCHGGDEFGDGDVAVCVVVEFDAGDLVDVAWDGIRGCKDGIGGKGWDFGVRLAVGGHDGN